MRHMTTILPFVDPIVVICITGQQLLDALEAGVSLWPALDGRFPQVSGIKFVFYHRVQLFFLIFFCIYDDRFSFDPSRPAGSRIVEAKLLAPERDIDVTKTYTLGTKLYVAEGHDGCK